MFPIRWNFPFRKKDGSLSTIGDVIEESGGYTLPTASADTLGGVKVGSGLNINDGVLSAAGGGGTQLYYKDFPNLDFSSNWIQIGETGWYAGSTAYLALAVTGYTPVFVVVTDNYTGYTPIASINRANKNPEWYAISMLAHKASTGNAFDGRVFYIKNEDLTPIPTTRTTKSKK